MPFVFGNSGVTYLAYNLSSVDTEIVLGLGEGDKFPTVDNTSGEIMTIVVETRRTGEREVMHCTRRVGDQLTVLRGMEGTTPQSWLATETLLSHRVTAEVYTSFSDTQATDDLQIQVDANAADISANAADIAVLDSEATGTVARVTQNEADIAQNASDISTNTAKFDDYILKSSSTISSSNPSGGSSGDVWYKV